MPEAVKKEALRELDRLSRMPVAAAEYSVSRTYLDWMVALPWDTRTAETIELKHTKEVLDADHSDLEKAKDRILEFLAVRKLNPDVKGPILCFVGPPGVGKTSLAKSIASSIDRKVVRVSLGGMRDEAEIRGHRRTYVGALPGQIIQGLRRAESKNRFSCSTRSISSAWIFGATRPRRCSRYLILNRTPRFGITIWDVPFDLSEVLFITTANVLDPIPPALRDRMEVLELPGYTEDEKLMIATDHLVGARSRTTDSRQSRFSSPSRLLRDHHPRLHSRGRRAKPGARDRCDLPEKLRGDGRRYRGPGRGDTRHGHRNAGRTKGSGRGGRRAYEESRRRAGLPGPLSVARSCLSRPPECLAVAPHADWPPGEVMKESARPRCRGSGPTLRPTASILRSIRTPRFTSTCHLVRSQRMALRPGSRWSPLWSRR